MNNCQYNHMALYLLVPRGWLSVDLAESGSYLVRKILWKINLKQWLFLRNISATITRQVFELLLCIDKYST